jgi:hypothetical protein
MLRKAELISAWNRAQAGVRLPRSEPLRDEAFFAKVVFHPELHTLVWPNGADFAPEFLREKLLVAATPRLG